MLLLVLLWRVFVVCVFAVCVVLLYSSLISVRVCLCVFWLVCAFVVLNVLCLLFAGLFYCYFLLFFSFFFSPSSTFLIEGVLGSKNLFSESCLKWPIT